MDEISALIEKYNFDKQFPKLVNKIRNKTVVVYGTGLLFRKLTETYDFSGLNIIGVSDLKYKPEDEGKKDFGYTIIPVTKINEYNPDYVLISALKFLKIIDNFTNNLFKGTDIKVLPLMDKPLLTLFKELLI